MSIPQGLEPVHRHPLGLPPGSVRAIIALLIAGLFWVLLLMPEDRFGGPIPLHIYGLLALVLIVFVVHRRDPVAPTETRQRPQWWLALIRLLLVAGFIGAVVWQYTQNPELLKKRLTPTPEMLPQWPSLLLSMAIGFGLGLLIRLGPWRNSAAVQDLQAWVSLLAMFGLVIEVLLEIFIQPELNETIDLNLWRNILTGVVAYYFGARS
jgi:hypothetical protein